MSHNKTSLSHTVVALVYFVLTTVISIILLLTALVVWMSDWIGSFTISALIVGAVFALLSALIYFVSLRKAIERIRDKVETIYAVAHAAQEGYNWVVEKFYMIMSLLK